MLHEIVPVKFVVGIKHMCCWCGAVVEPGSKEKCAAPLYVAGGGYKKGDQYQFDLVCASSRSRCYITRDSAGVMLTEHHSHVYKLETGESGSFLTLAVMHGEASSVQAPCRVELTAQMRDQIDEAIRYAVDYGRAPKELSESEVHRLFPEQLARARSAITS